MEVGNERLAAVEADVKHLSQDVGDIKAELKAINEINKGVGESLAKLTLLAEQNQKRDDKIVPRVDNIEKWMHKKDALIVLIVGVFTLFKDQIAGFLGL